MLRVFRVEAGRARAVEVIAMRGRRRVVACMVIDEEVRLLIVDVCMEYLRYCWSESNIIAGVKCWNEILLETGERSLDVGIPVRIPATSFLSYFRSLLRNSNFAYFHRYCH